MDYEKQDGPPGQPLPVGEPWGTSLKPPESWAVTSTRSPKSRIEGDTYGLRPAVLASDITLSSLREVWDRDHFSPLSANSNPFG